MEIYYEQECHVRKCATQLAGGLLLKMLKYFEVMLNIFEFSHMKEIVESWQVCGISFHESSNHVTWLRQ